MKFGALIVTLVLLNKQRAVRGQDSATPCTQPDGSKGICIKVRDCQSAIRLIQLKKSPKTCWFEGNEPVVCCSDRLTGQAKAKMECDSIANWSSNTNLYSTMKRPEVKYIVGGVSSLEGEFPHMAALGYGTPSDITWGCGGSLISRSFVLTAAHCINTRDLGDVKFVRLGITNLSNPKRNGIPQDFKVLRTIKHPNYRPPQQYDDIALIELSSPAATNRDVMPACLQTDRSIGSPSWSATGWGNTEYGGDPSDALQKVSLREYSVQECSKTFNSNDRRLKDGIVDDKQICAGELKKDTCQGDSGGPLQYKTGSGTRGHTIIGVTSFGKACGLTSAPSVYTRVSYYIDWIAATVWP